MKILHKAKDNLFVVLVAASYAGMFMLRPNMGITSVKNSAYYIREMLLIMPVIFVLTALLDLWVPKEKIMKYLGKEAKIRGIVFALVLGSISAGPIYAAFPLCVMLHKKGASVRNLVIILSAWAVIKVPMLLNELKFLGFKYMAVRWVLTVIAIILFSWITALLVKDNDLPRMIQTQQGVSINGPACIGCGLCAATYPGLFGLKSHKAVPRSMEGPIDAEKLLEAISACPVKAITSTEKEG